MTYRYLITCASPCSRGDGCSVIRSNLRSRSLDQPRTVKKKSGASEISDVRLSPFPFSVMHQNYFLNSEFTYWRVTRLFTNAIQYMNTLLFFI